MTEKKPLLRNTKGEVPVNSHITLDTGHKLTRRLAEHKPIQVEKTLYVYKGERTLSKYKL